MQWIRTVLNRASWLSLAGTPIVRLYYAAASKKEFPRILLWQGLRRRRERRRKKMGDQSQKWLFKNRNPQLQLPQNRTLTALISLASRHRHYGERDPPQLSWTSWHWHLAGKVRPTLHMSDPLAREGGKKSRWHIRSKSKPRRSRLCLSNSMQLG